ncbi:GAF domain-containing protein [Haloarculaceae archaeon H-GB2-1]|nr:GAF domain-containing protein [Haloarculaceae archaeon H-GB1-1]MEA5386875.1 GAF domain-containing protein [Haloarculaceae archaeon H-GB11]MEA5408353.1 GAF domain-containing protein [Haloarculaceae archaeon H-GB2-1]
MTTARRVVFLGTSTGVRDLQSGLASLSGEWTVDVAETVDATVLRQSSIECVVFDVDSYDSERVVNVVGESVPIVAIVDADDVAAIADLVRDGVCEWFPTNLLSADPESLAVRVRNVADRSRRLQRETQLDRINRVVRDVHRELVRATDRASLEQRVCDVISGSEPYVFAWIGENDPETAELKPRASAGIEQSYLDEISVTTDATATGKGPAGTAYRTREVAVVQNMAESESFEPWRQAATERGYRSAAAIPIQYRDDLLGMLLVYSDRQFAFDENERALLESVAEDLGFAIDSIENRKRVDRYSELTQHAPVGIYRTEAIEGGRIVEANPALASIFDAETPDDLIGEQVRDFYIDPEDREALVSNAMSDTVTQVEMRFRTLAGDEVWGMLTEIYFEDADGTAYFDGALTDVTQRKEFERQLQEQNDLLEERSDQFEFFNDLLRHEVLNGMSVILGNADRLASEWPDDERPPMIEVIRSRSNDIVDVVQNVREVLDRLTAEDFELSVVDIGEVLSHRVAYLQSVYPEANVSLDVSEPEPVLADEFLGDALDNVLQNAVQHNDAANPSVDVTVTSDGATTTVAIADDGPGVPDEKKSELFEPTDVPLDSAAHGFGLYFVNTLVSRYGGAIEVWDNDPTGAVFELTFQSARE